MQGIYSLLEPEIVIAPPSIYLIALQQVLRKDVKVSAQNCYCKLAGAFTGEIRYVYFLEVYNTAATHLNYEVLLCWLMPGSRMSFSVRHNIHVHAD